MANYALISDQPPEPYEAWLVKALEKLRGYKPDSIAIVAIPGAECPDEDVSMVTNYWHAEFMDKHLMAAAINDDAMWQLVQANMDRYLDELEAEEDEEDEENEEGEKL